VAVCFNRADARFTRRGKACRRARIASWTLLKPTGDPALAGLPLAVVGIGAATLSGATVTFAPPLDVEEICTAAVPIVIPAVPGKAGMRLLKTRTVGGTLRDVDTLRLVCIP